MLEQELFKNRSYVACLSSAYKLVCNNFKSIVRQTWLPIVCMSVVTGVWRSVFLHAGQTSPAADVQTSLLLSLCSLLLFLAYVVTHAWFVGRLTAMQTDFNGKKSFWRSLKAMCTLYGAVFVLAIVLGILLAVSMTVSKMPSNALLATLGISAVCLVVMLPLSYSLTKYLLDDNTKAIKGILFKDCREGWKHWGFLFAVNFLAGIILGLLSLVVSMPTLLMMAAQSADGYGMELGDPSGLPGSFTVLSLVVSILTTMVSSVLMIVYYWTLIYAYGAIEERRQARQLAEQNIIMQ